MVRLLLVVGKNLEIWVLLEPRAVVFDQSNWWFVVAIFHTILPDPAILGKFGEVWQTVCHAIAESER